MVASANRWVQRIAIWVWQATGTWEFDDGNQTDLPIATTTLVTNQQDYALPATALKLFRVQIKDIGGNWQHLTQIDQTEVIGALDEFQKTAGVPRFYDIIGNSLFLYPKPDTAQVTASAGLKIFFAREATTFSTPASYTTADTTEPGFSESFHDLVPLGIAYDWCLTNGPDDRTKVLRQEIEAIKGDLIQQYGSKNADKKVKFKMRQESYI